MISFRNLKNMEYFSKKKKKTKTKGQQEVD
jgi:hypothetical protein